MVNERVLPFDPEKILRLQPVIMIVPNLDRFSERLWVEARGNQSQPLQAIVPLANRLQIGGNLLEAEKGRPPAQILKAVHFGGNNKSASYG
jgi:hypothetical protein